jgi:hypothetical protein
VRAARQHDYDNRAPIIRLHEHSGHWAEMLCIPVYETRNAKTRDRMRSRVLVRLSVRQTFANTAQEKLACESRWSAQEAWAV